MITWLPKKRYGLIIDQDSYSTYYIVSRKTDTNSSTSYRWYAVNLQNHAVSDTNIDTACITLFDEYIVDGYGNKNKVTQ